MKQLDRMKKLIAELNQAAKSYYQEDKEIMSNREYDEKYNQLLALEEKLNTVLSNSPTINVGYEILSQLPKEEHVSSMLSLNKTKDREELVSWIKDKEGMLSFKLDGLTIILTYNNGELIKAATRGNGFIGEVVTNNAKTFTNIPMNIPYKEELVLRGEALILYSDFEKINEKLEIEDQYKNPRNLSSGSVRQLNNEITAKRNVRFYGFALVSCDYKDALITKSSEIDWLSELGFECVEYMLVNKGNLLKALEKFSKKVESSDIGTDGLVLTFNDKKYSDSLGVTSKFPKDMIAFKWQDEVKETILSDVFWSASRTGLINPVAIFEPVELEGTLVARASLHNISIIEKLELGIGDSISVYKANMIIPQIAKNNTKSNNLILPDTCPVCGLKAIVKNSNDIKVLYCSNNECAAKKIKSFAHYVSRNAMNIEGLSEATLEKLIQLGAIHKFSDLYKLDNEEIKDTIINLEGFGEKSYINMIESIEASKTPKMANFIFSLGILHVGLSNAKLLVKAYKNDIEKIINASSIELASIEGFGEIIAKSLYDFFHNADKLNVIRELLEYIKFEMIETSEINENIKDKTFVITGSLEKYDNRNILKEKIEELGGKVTGSVSAKTDYLINNDMESNSSKNKKAKKLNIPIISEEDFSTLID